MMATIERGGQALAAELAEVRAERDQLRALVLDMLDAAEVRAELARADAQAIGAEQYAEGHRAGHERGARALDDQWAAYWAGRAQLPSLAEVETDRWGPGGREHFADPRPGDRTGDQIAADAIKSWKNLEGDQ